jgi:very-short-patch-repair endonuclease
VLERRVLVVMRPKSGSRRGGSADLAIARLAARQHGVVTRQQLLEIGLGSEAIKWRLRIGRLHPIHIGVFAVGHRAITEKGREMAAVLACGPGAALGRTWAATRWGMPIPRRSRRPEVVVPRRGLERRGIETYAAVLLPRDIRRLDRIPVTSPPRTIRDLATILDEARLERVVAHALDRDLVRRSQLLDQVERNRGGRGIAALRRLADADRTPSLTASEAEVRLLAAVRDGGLPEPQANAGVGGYKVDLLWREARLIVELDGYEFHSDRAAFETDRLRDAELGDLGYRVIRVTWRQLVGRRDEVVGRIGRALAQTGRPA